jgi:prolyl-tRNA synthetase
MPKLTKQSEDFSAWYNEVVQRAELAENAPVRGCMVIRPYGFAIWELLQARLDRMIKDTGHVNAYFPLFIPESFIKREAEHVEGFSPELAVVTVGGGSQLEEPLIVRPTSETIINAMYAKWVQSWRDLPVLINQWANVVRWEMRPRLFLRTTEFLWQEGHTAHETQAEAHEEALKMLHVYKTFAEETLAMPVLTGAKSEAERFAGAAATYPIEALMKDNRALQAGTSHELGQNFAKAFNIQFQSREGQLEYVWQTSWGVSTRLVGGVVMCHGDDKGLVLPPAVAPYQVVLVPIWKNDAERDQIKTRLAALAPALREKVRLFVDDRDQYNPGWKFNEWELKGAPVRVELGPRDLAAGTVVVARRDTGAKSPAAQEGLADRLVEFLADIQRSLLAAAVARREANTHRVDTYDALRTLYDGAGGFALAPWCGRARCETQVKDDTKATIRVVPFEPIDAGAPCIICGQSAPTRVYFAKAY